MALLASLLFSLSNNSTVDAKPSDLIVSPYIQLGDRVANGSHSVAVVWHTSMGNHSYTVRFRQGARSEIAASAAQTIKVDGIEPHQVWTATIKSFLPGQPIDYELTSGKTKLFSSSFMAPKAANQPYSFTVFGDCGCDTLMQKQIAYQTFRLKPNALFITGDIVYGNGRISEYRKNYFPQYSEKNPWPSKGAPIISQTLTIAAPGNHDILNRNLNEHADGLAYYYYWKQPLNGPITNPFDASAPTLSGAETRKAAFRAGAGKSYPRMSNFSFTYGNAFVLALDSNPYVDWNRPDMRGWVSGELAKGASMKWRFVIFHHPGFHSSDNHQSAKQMRRVADLFEKGKVDIVFAGHVHNYQRSHPIRVGDKAGKGMDDLAKDDWDIDESFNGNSNTKPKGVIYIVSGAGGARLYNPELSGNPDKWKPFQAEYIAKHSLTFVEVKEGRLTLRQIDFNGKELDRIVVTK